MKKPKEIKYSEIASYARMTIRKLGHTYYNEQQAMGDCYDATPEEESQNDQFVKDMYKELNDFLAMAFGKRSIKAVKALYDRFNYENDIEAFHEIVDRIKEKGFKNYTLIQDIPKYETTQQVLNDNQRDIFKAITNKGE